MDLVQDLDLYEKVGNHEDTVRRVISLSVEIAREGIEGKPTGTMFIIGDSKNVLKKSQPLILDLFNRLQVEVRSIHNADTRETIKKLASLDGAFLISGEGIVIAAARYINPDSFGNVALGVGTRHVTGAAITAETKSVAIIVSSSGNIRVYARGEIIREYKVEIKLKTCITNDFDKSKNKQRLKNVPVFNCDEINYIVPQPDLSDNPLGFQTKDESKINNIFQVINISYDKNNRSMDYSFVSKTHLTRSQMK